MGTILLLPWINFSLGVGDKQDAFIKSAHWRKQSLSLTRRRISDEIYTKKLFFCYYRRGWFSVFLNHLSIANQMSRLIKLSEERYPGDSIFRNLRMASLYLISLWGGLFLR